MGRHGGPRRSCNPVGSAILAFVFGVFTAMILPVTLLAVIEGALIIILGIIIIRR